MPECTEMMWTKFAEQTNKQPYHTILSYACFHVGTTTTISRSTIRRTAGSKHLALVMETDTGDCLIALSKAQGCETEQRRMLNFLGWMRRCEVIPKDRLAWEQIDDEINMFYHDVSSDVPNNVDEKPKHLAKQVAPSSREWRELLMVPRQNKKGMWRYVYVAYIDGQYFTLLNKGASYLQTGTLETWNPPRATCMPPDQKLSVHWLWSINNELHFTTADGEEYIVSYGDLVCRRRSDHAAQLPIWMDKFGLIEPHTNKYFPAALVEHIAGRSSWKLPLNAFVCQANDKIAMSQHDCTHIHQALHSLSPNKLTVSWREGPWFCSMVRRNSTRGHMNDILGDDSSIRLSRSIGSSENDAMYHIAQYNDIHNFFHIRSSNELTLARRTRP